jgi:long-subunit acyl-CoA synthetase (AMP-forming)
MTKWYNYGVIVTDDGSFSEIVTALESLGMIVYSERNKCIKATESARNINPKQIEKTLKNFSNHISVVISVTANDTSDTASGIVYEINDNGTFEKIRSELSGDEDSRYNWRGISHSGLSIDGGKYY